MLGFLRRAKAKAPSKAQPKAGPNTSLTTQQGPRTTPAATEELPADFGELASRIGLPPPADPPQAWPDEERFAERLVEHYFENQAAPSAAPTLALRVLNLVASNSTSLRELAAVIEKDPALTAGLLKVANSAAFAGVMELESVRDAVTRLGQAEVGRVAGMVAARSLFNPAVRGELARFAPLWSRLFCRSATVAHAAAWQAMKHREAKSNRVFLGGMLHDIGKTAGLRLVSALVQRQELPALTEEQVERLLEKVHVQLGVEVHRSWSLPEHSQLICAMHHGAGLSNAPDLLELHLVRLVSALAGCLDSPASPPSTGQEILESTRALGLNAFALRALVTQVRASSTLMAQAFA